MRNAKNENGILRNAKYEMKIPRPHQQEAIEAALAHYQENDNGLMQMACGSGKTLTSLWIAEKLKAENIVVALPSLQLQAQSVGTWLLEAQELDLNILVIGSDKSISDIFGVAVTTDAQEIASFLLRYQHQPKVIFTTYQSTNALIDGCDIANQVFDFGIIDEAHETAGNDAKLFGKILFDDNGIVIKKRLFMTATPKFFDDDKLISMNDKEIYGEIFYRLPTEEAIQKGILSDYKLLVIYLDDKDSLSYTTKQKNAKISHYIVPRRYLAINEFLAKAIAKYEMRKIVSFHKSVDLAKSFYELVKQNNSSLYVFNIDNAIKIKDRFDILNSFKNLSPSIITNPRVLIQGYDLPEIDAVLWTDISTNQFQITQGNGRALRRHESKKMGYVLCPIFIDQNGVVNKKEFDALSKALSNMVASDNRLNQYFSKKTAGGEDDEETDIVNIVNYTEKVDLKILETLSKNLSIRVWNRTKVLQYRTWEDFVTTIREICPAMGISSRGSYNQWADNNGDYAIRFPLDMPKSPESVYSEYWEGWDALFQKRGKNDIMSYEEAHDIAKQACEKYGICSAASLLKWKKGLLKNVPIFPERMAISPDKSYKEEFVSWTDFFGIPSRERNYASFEEATRWAIEQNFKKRSEFYATARPGNIPSNPDRIYKSQWQGWDVFLGKNKSKKKDFMPYEKAKSWVKDNLLPMGVDSFAKYHQWVKSKDFKVEKPLNLPTSPDKIYATEWEGWDIFFGKEKYYKNYYDTEIIVFDKNKELLNTYGSIKEAAAALGLKEKYIVTAIKRETLVKRQYFFKFKDDKH